MMSHSQIVSLNADSLKCNEEFVKHKVETVNQRVVSCNVSHYCVAVRLSAGRLEHLFTFNNLHVAYSKVFVTKKIRLEI